MTSKNLLERIRYLSETGKDVAEWEHEIWKAYGCQRAVVVLDSTGFTRVTSSHGIVHYLILLSRLRETVANVFNSHGCVRTRTAADNVYAQFHDAKTALDAAIAANAAIHSQNLMITESEPFTLCIGIGFGTLLDAGNEGLYGEEMNYASTLGEDIAEGREILLTRAAWEQLPEVQKNLFEERYHGYSDRSLQYYWMHWKA